MKILALETSGLSGSVAVADDQRILYETDLPDGQRSARGLAPAMKLALGQVGWKPSAVELIAVTCGPGSFTGLRVGVVTAKAFAYATGCRVVGLDTLEVLAEQVAAPGDDLLAVLDAQRGEFFAARWKVDAVREFQLVEPARILTADQVVERLAAGEKIIGPVADKLTSALPPYFHSLVTMPKASAVAALGYRKALLGEIIDPFALVPHYLRRTAAEEQWETRQAANN